MTKGAIIFNRYKKIIIIAVLLVLFVAMALILFGGKNQLLTINSNSAGMSDTEIKLMRILSEIDGVGKAEVMITESEGGVDGVVIVCEGANNLMTRSDVINAVKVALNIEKNNIAIYAMN